jgi:hypothetical protein
MLQDVIGECSISSLLGPGFQVLTVAEIRGGSPVWHSPASPDDEWNEALLLPDGRTVVWWVAREACLSSDATRPTCIFVYWRG